MDINLSIQENENIKIVGIDPDSHTLTICDFDPSENPHVITAPHLYDTLEANNKNFFNGKKIIEKEERNNEVIYHFNQGLSINSMSGKTNEFYCFSFWVLGDKERAKESSQYKKFYRWDGREYRSIFHKPLYLTCSFLERVHFAHCEFYGVVSTHANPQLLSRIEFHNGISFDDCKFFDSVLLKGVVSGAPLDGDKYFNNAQDTIFSNCHFNKQCNLSNSTFCNQIKFDKSVFYEDSDFHGCTFKQTTSFYGCTFKKPANFSQVIFKENANFVNSKMNFTFYDLNEHIYELEKQYKKQTKIHKINIASDYQDSFRLLKNTLIKDGNVLEASQYYKFELYAKEIALKNTKELIEPKTYSDGYKNISQLAKAIDRLQLAFYRHLCDHHTDLLRVVNNLIITISIYACLIIMLSTNIKEEFLSEHFSLSELIDVLISNAFGISRVIVLVVLIILLLILCVHCARFFISFLTNIPSKNNNGISLLSFVKQDFFNAKILFIFIVVAVLIYAFLDMSQAYVLPIKKIYPPSFIALNLTMFAMIVLPIFISQIVMRGILIAFSYWIFFSFVLPNISLINPAIKDIFGATPTDLALNTSMFAIVICLHMALQGIILWSLQKTARKNSIIPS